MTPFWHRYRNDPRYEVLVDGGCVQVMRRDVVRRSDLRDLRLGGCIMVDRPADFVVFQIPLTPLWFWS